ncbi:MAG: hypothetical protein GX217_07070 [Clostridiaceae bacterium]|nr:hypothetical protein [Clostridiaceae bacterium]
MKRIIAVVLSLLVLLATASCTSTPDASLPTAPGNSNEVSPGLESESTPPRGQTDTEAPLPTSETDGHDSRQDSDINPMLGYITGKETVVETKYITFRISKGIYVPYKLEKYADSLYTTIEEVSGLSFRSSPDSLRPVVTIERPDFSVYTNINKTSEVAQAYATGNAALCCPGELFLGKSYTILHELCHVLNMSQEYTYPGKVLSEGFAEYTSYRVLMHLAENDPETYYALWPVQSFINNMMLNSPDAIHKNTMEHWLSNGFPGAMNGDYALGFRLMAYFDDTYEDYTAWIPVVAKMDEDTSTGDLLPDNQIKVITDTYGEKVFDDFYKWLKNNEKRFAWETNIHCDMSMLSDYRIFPEFNAVESIIKLVAYAEYTVAYDNLTIHLDALRFYLETYKDFSTQGLVLNTDAKTVELYDEDGKLIDTISLGHGEISLEGVDKVCLVGKGELTTFEITGFEE